MRHQHTQVHVKLTSMQAHCSTLLHIRADSLPPLHALLCPTGPLRRKRKRAQAPARAPGAEGACPGHGLQLLVCGCCQEAVLVHSYLLHRALLLLLLCVLWLQGSALAADHVHVICVSARGSSVACVLSVRLPQRAPRYPMMHARSGSTRLPRSHACVPGASELMPP